MREDPYVGDVARLRGIEPAAWRRRHGSYRILFDLYPDRLLPIVYDILRRTSKTY